MTPEEQLTVARRWVEELERLVDTLTVQLHESRRSNIRERSGHIARDLAALRVEINALRFSAGLGPSPVLSLYDTEEQEAL